MEPITIPECGVNVDQLIMKNAALERANKQMRETILGAAKELVNPRFSIRIDGNPVLSLRLPLTADEFKQLPAMLAVFERELTMERPTDHFVDANKIESAPSRAKEEGP